MKKINKIYKKYSKLFFFYKKAIKHSFELSTKQNNLKKIKQNNIILFSTMKNEAHRLDFFINYYRNLGVDHFIFVDNDSDDSFYDVINNQDDITAFHTKGSYKESNFGMHWLNYLLFRFGRGHWCLTCDPDEFLVYPFMETRNLRDLTGYLSSLKQNSFFSVMLDMYSDLPVEETTYTEGDNPLDVCPFYDSSSLKKQYNPSYKNLYIQGGVRQRVFSKESPEAAPALNKLPLIKWSWDCAYVESMHMALPKKLNNVCFKEKTTGALLHFKFINKLTEKVKEELVKKQHFNDSAEYKQYDQVIKDKTILYDSEVSKRYKNWEDLAEAGLINIGEW